MDNGYSTAASDRGPSVRNGSDGGGKVETHPNVPRTYSTGGNTSVPKGYYVYPKNGEIIFFYVDPNGSQRQPKGKNQVNEPKRSGFELVGTTTGKTQSGLQGTFLEVNWLNSYTDHNLLKPDIQVNESRTGWVDASKVECQAQYQSVEDKQSGSNQEPDIAAATSSTGLDATTLGYGAIAAALILGTKKKRR